MTREQIIQTCVAVVLAGVAIAYDARRKNWKKIVAPAATYLDLVAFAQATVGLPAACDAAKSFFDNAAALYKTYKDSIQTNETKIGTLLGYVGGGTGVLALLSGTSVVAAPALTPLLILAIVSLATVFWCALEGLRPVRHSNVDVAQLCDFSLLSSPSGASRMNALMGWQYLEASRELVAITLTKARWLKRCYNGFALGVIALVLNALLPIPQTPNTPSASITLNCTIPTQAKLDCTLKPSETKK